MLYQRTDPEERQAAASAMHGGFGEFALRAPSWRPSTYAASTRGRPAAVLASALAVGGLLLALVSLNVHPPRHRHQDLAMVDLTLPPPPPPAERPPEPVTKAPAPKVAPAVFAPPPIVTPPVAAPSPVAVSPTPVPPPSVPVAATAPPAPVAAPVSRPADAGDLSSKMISATPPTYPLDSRRKHEQGTVVLSVMLGPDGAVSDIAVATSSGSDRLDHAALVAVRRWRWSPTIRDGAPVEVRGTVRIPFVLAG